ncbi:terpenoid synthase [Durotheca rogersii]|uniref:terpenoid synthase n=1 Tax=Durotheca rogersii TaxID=419775 RepID=UPI00221E87E5|nr:terpenoid synthase [Durotheca rogersii]KAI5864558.1 terpenoid synthase [Durotheca rogersii]
MESRKMETLLGLTRRLRSKLLSMFLSSRPTKAASPLPPPEETQPSDQQGLCGEALTLATQLHGQTFHLPDLWKIFADWPMAASPHAERLEILVNEMLERITTDERKLKALKRADFARLLSLWYPDSEWDELVIATAYSVWIFVWDDEVDAGDTEVSTDEELARAYYQKSLDVIRNLLGLVPGNEEGALDLSGSLVLRSNMDLFVDVGSGMRPTTDKLQRERFYRELENFMINVGVEHSLRMRGAIPTVARYLEIRSGSVGCAPQIAITDSMLKIRLPESIMDCAAMKELWKETVLICLILNDIYSVQKEIAQGSLFNLVPVMYKNCSPETQNLDTVTRQIEETLRGSMRGFETAAAALDAETAGDAKVNEDARRFVRWCRYFTTGVLQWSLESQRYGMAKCVREDGSLEIVL